MRTQVLLLSSLLAACGTTASDPFAPDANAAADDRRTLAGAYDRTAVLRARLDELQKELDAVSSELATVSDDVAIHGVDVKLLQSQMSTVSSTVDGHVTILKGMDTEIDALDGHVTVLKAAATDVGEGTCAFARERGSGLATGRRQHMPLRMSSTTHTWGDPHEYVHGGVVRSSDVQLLMVDTDGDRSPDVVVLEADVDGDGFSDQIELGGDRDGDGDLYDDALELDQADETSIGQVCGSTSHL